MTDEDGAVFLDVNTNVLDMQLRSASDASFNPPVLEAVSAGLTLDLAPVIKSISCQHFVELLVPPTPSGLTCVEEAGSSLLVSWNCDAVGQV